MEMRASTMLIIRRYFYDQKHSLKETLWRYRQWTPEQIKDALGMYKLEDEPAAYVPKDFRKKWDEARKALGII